MLNVSVVPTIWRGVFDRVIIEDLCDSLNVNTQEGLVVRLVDSFDYSDFGMSVAKYVRSGHVQTSEHWMYQSIIQNQLINI